MGKPSEARSVKELVRFTAQSKKAKYVFFWGHTPKVKGRIDNSCFSQWYPSPFEHEGRTYPTAEHFMMVAKAELFSDDERLAEILRAGSPGKAKAIGRNVVGFSQTTWEEHRFDIVVEANYRKFRSDPRLTDHIVATGNRVLVEASAVDKIWGIGLTAEEATNVGPTSWKGLNLLGFALMEARARIVADDA